MLNTGSKDTYTTANRSRKRSHKALSDHGDVSPSQQSSKKAKIANGRSVQSVKASTQQVRIERQNEKIDQLRSMLNVRYKPETLTRITDKNRVQYNLDAMTPFERDSLVLREIKNGSALDNGEVLQLTTELLKKYEQIARLSQYATGLPVNKQQIFRIAMEQVFPEQDIKPWYGCWHRRKGLQDAMDEYVEKETPPTLDYLPLPQCLLTPHRQAKATPKTVAEAMAEASASASAFAPTSSASHSSPEPVAEDVDLAILLQQTSYDDGAMPTSSPQSTNPNSVAEDVDLAILLQQTSYNAGAMPTSIPQSTSPHSAAEDVDLAILLKQLPHDDGPDANPTPSFHGASSDSTSSDSPSLDSSSLNSPTSFDSFSLENLDTGSLDDSGYGTGDDDPLALCEPEQQMLETMNQLMRLVDDGTESSYPCPNEPQFDCMPLLAQSLLMDCNEPRPEYVPWLPEGTLAGNNNDVIDELGDLSSINPDDCWLPQVMNAPANMPAPAPQQPTVFHPMPQQQWQAPVINNTTPDQMASSMDETSLQLQQLLDCLK